MLGEALRGGFIFSNTSMVADVFLFASALSAMIW